MAKNKIEIPKLILDHLLQYGNTSILGLGTLFFDNHSAYFSDDKSQIFPPSNTLLFKDRVHDTDQFAHYVANRLGINPVKALEKVDKYAQSLINNLLNFGRAEIPSIGTFVKEDGKLISFEQEKGEINSEFFGLTPVKLKPIQFYKSGETANTEMAVSTANMAARSNTATTIAVSDTAAPSYNYNDDDDSSWLKPLLWILGLLLLSALAYKGCQSYMTNQSQKPPVEIVDDVKSSVGDNDDKDGKGSDGQNGKNVVNGSADSKDTTADTTDKVKAPTECVIILGAYESARNAMKMSTKISQLGYKPYEEYFDTMDVTRVGFKFDCSEKDLRDFMYEVRKEIAPDAWYLVPRITVE